MTAADSEAEYTETEKNFICWLIIKKPQPNVNLHSGPGHLYSRDSCLGPKSGP